MERTRRDLLNDMAEHRPIFKNNQITYPRFSFTHRYSISKTGVLFPLCAEFLTSNNLQLI